MEKEVEEFTLQSENILEKKPFWQKPRILIVIFLVSVFFIGIAISFYLICRECKKDFVQWCGTCKADELLPRPLNTCLSRCFLRKFPKTPQCDYVCREISEITSPKPEPETEPIFQPEKFEKFERDISEKSAIEEFLPAPEVGGVKVFVKTSLGKVKPGETVQEKVIFDSTMDKTEFYLFWGESLTTKSDLDLVIIRPDGTLIDESAAKTDPEIEFASGPGYEFYRGVAAWSKEKSWQYGEWGVRIFGKSVPSEGESYTFEVPASDAMNYSINLDKESYLVGEPIKIEAAIEDLFLDVTEPQYIFGMSIQIEIESPSQNIYHLVLYDDGVHGDGEANDGIYANTFPNTSLPGKYKFKLTASGLNNRHGQFFTRECFFFTEVKPKS